MCLRKDADELTGADGLPDDSEPPSATVGHSEAASSRSPHTCWHTSNIHGTRVFIGPSHLHTCFKYEGAIPMATLTRSPPQAADAGHFLFF